MDGGVREGTKNPRRGSKGALSARACQTSAEASLSREEG